jgi:hypothetical protein
MPADEQRKRPVGDVRALCCECGNLRMVRSRFRSRDSIGDLDSRHPDLWRMVDMLACSVCGHETRHARLRDDTPKHRDVAEERDHNQAAKRARGLEHLDDYELLNGARPRVVEIMDRFSDNMRPSDLTLEDCYRILDTYKQVADDHGLET